MEVDEIQRKINQVEIEKNILKKESDPASKERLKKLEAALGEMKAEPIFFGNALSRKNLL